MLTDYRLVLNIRGNVPGKCGMDDGIIEAPFNTIFTLPHIVCTIVTIFTMLIFSFYEYTATVEPPITDPPRSGQPLHSGQRLCCGL